MIKFTEAEIFMLINSVNRNIQNAVEAKTALGGEIPSAGKEIDRYINRLQQLNQKISMLNK